MAFLFGMFNKGDSKANAAERIARMKARSLAEIRAKSLVLSFTYAHSLDFAKQKQARSANPLLSAK
jgi:hypothetical protein